MGRSNARKLHRAAPVDIHVLHKKTAEALDRGAFQSARESAKELFRRDPTAEHRRLLVESTLGRAVELRRSGLAVDAATIVRSIVDAGFDSPEQAARAVRELLLAGDWRLAGPLIARITDSALLVRLNAARADGAVLQGPRGLAQLPTELRADTQRVLVALDAIARADDRAATEAVASIPADSQFAEWRLLIEALTAFHAGQSALESWNALSPDRVPATIASPFRAHQDRAFLNVAPAWQQSELKSIISRLNTAPWLAALEDVQRLVAQEDIGAAVRRAGDVLKVMPPSDDSAFRTRLARVMYWIVAGSGSHQHIDSYRRAFGPPPDDPHGHRLRAIQAENEDDDWEAQGAWAAFDRDIAEGGIVPESDRGLARSLVWFHIGGIAERYGSPLPPNGETVDESEDDFEHDWDDRDGESHDPRDDAEDDEFDSGARYSASLCYRRSVELAPQNRKAHEFLIDLLDYRGNTKEVVAAATRMIEIFPDHERALGALSRDAAQREHWDVAVAYQERAVRARPHDAFLAEQLGFYQLSLARQQAQQGRFDDARAVVNAMLEKKKGDERYSILCRLASVELLAGQPERGEQLFDEACRAAPSRLAAVYRMLIEAIRMPLDYGRAMRLEADFRELIRGRPDAATVRELVACVSAFHQTRTSYEGLKDHETLVLQFVKRAKRLNWSHADLVVVCKSLNALPGEKLTLDFAKRGMKLFPDDPQFPFFAGMYFYALGPQKCPLGKLIRFLSDAEKLAQGKPEHTELSEAAGRILRSVRAFSAISNLNRWSKLFGRRAPLPAHLVNEIESALGVPLGDPFGADDAEDDWPDEPTQPRRRRR